MPHESSCAYVAGTREASYPVHDSVGWVDGMHAGVAQRFRKKRTSCLLLEQKVHSLGDELLFAGKNVLRFGMGIPSSKALYVEPYYLVGIQDGPSQVHFREAHSYGWIARWQVLLSEFDIVYVTQKVIKGSALANYLAQQPLNDYQPMHPEFSDEDIMALFEEKSEDKDKDKWILWFDSASNALDHKVGAALVSPNNQ